MASGIAAFAFACIFSILGLALILSGFATNNWVVVNVSEQNVSSEADGLDGYAALAYMDRDVGLFRICFESSPVLDAIPDKASDRCIKNHHEIKTRNEDVDGSSDYMIHVHLMRAAIAGFIICILFVLIGILLGFIGCCFPRYTFIRIAGILVLVGVFFGCCGLGLWIGAYIVEYEEVTETNLKEVIPFFKTGSTTLQDSTTKRLGRSFFYMCVGLFLCLIGCLLYLGAAACLVANAYDDDDDLRKSRYREEAPPVVYSLGYDDQPKVAAAPYNTHTVPPPYAAPALAPQQQPQDYYDVRQFQHYRI